MKIPYIISNPIQPLSIQTFKVDKPTLIQPSAIYDNIESEKLIEAQRAYVGIDLISFGYNHSLKTLFLKGKLPFVKVGFYGEPLSKHNVSLEHLEPVHEFKKKYCDSKAKRLATVWENLVLADRYKNTERGCEPLSSYINIEAMNAYLDQFIGQEIPGYGSGEKYIKAIRKTVYRLINSNN